MSQTTLADAVGSGSLNLDNFTAVGPGTRAGQVHAAGRAPSPLNHDIAKSLSCEGGASASLTGKLEMSVTPAFHASFSSDSC